MTSWLSVTPAEFLLLSLPQPRVCNLCFFWISGYAEHGGPQRFMDMRQIQTHLYPQLLIQISQRFIHQKHLRRRTTALPSSILCTCPPDSAPGFRSSKCSRFRIRAASFTIRSICSSGTLRSFSSKRHVVVDRHMPVNAGILKYNSHIPVFGIHIIDHPSAQLHRS